MDETHDIATVIKELQTAANKIEEAVNWLSAHFYKAESHPELKPTERQITLEEVRAVLAEKSRAGHTAKIRELLQKYGADRLSAVDPIHYKALLADAEELSNAGT